MNEAFQLEDRSGLKRLDVNFVLVVIALNIIGLINLYSATHGAAATGLSQRFLVQTVWIGIGWTLFMVVTFVDYKIWTRAAYLFFVVNLIALAAVPFLGKSIYGSKRWLDLGFFHYQPSETMKVILVIVLARTLSKVSSPGGLGIKQLVWPLTLTAIPFIMTVKQPDLGTALMFFAIAFSMILFVGVKKKLLIGALVTFLVALPLAWQFGMKPYQKNRVLTFLDPSRDPRGAGYNSNQSIIAVGSGKILGKGFRKGTQSQLEFLPERHTDFIFSVLSEEHGFIGSMTTLGLYFILFFLGIRTGTQARDKTGALLAVGGLALVFWHMFVNIGMVIGLLPIVGIPLPLLSYGGSNLLPTMVALGLVSSVSLRKFLF